MEVLEMCGITGIYDIKGRAIDQLLLERMTNILKHRGPDDEGYVLINTFLGNFEERIGKDTLNEIKDKNYRNIEEDHHSNLGLGHRRLSIIDLSPKGHQPMSNEDNNIWIVYNGEVYNYIEIREELKNLGHNLRSNSDTEVIIHAYEEWGESCLDRFNGMWAFALWDQASEKMFCARDRLGIKPFYYYFDEERFIFASEIKAILEDRRIIRKPNEKIIYDYLKYGIIDHAEETFFDNILQLRPAHYLILRKKDIEIKRYWDIYEINEEFESDKKDEEYAKRFYELFEDSIRLRLRSDVPIGTCLSGGLDSSSVVCTANKLMFSSEVKKEIVGEKQKTFSSCYKAPEEKKYDEREYIEEVIKETNAEKNYVFPSGEKLFDEILRLIWHQDEPFGSTSVYAQWNVMRKAKERNVKVLLDGQGGDELLAGYIYYMPVLLSNLLINGKIITFFREILLSENSFMHAKYCLKLISSKLHKKLEYLGKKIMEKEDYDIINPILSSKFKDRTKFSTKEKTNLKKILYKDLTLTSLPGLLHYEDRNSMAFSIESRLPFLDYRLVEYIFSLPNNQIIRDGVTKVVLRNAMKRVLPDKVMMRKSKLGFPTPEDVWMKKVFPDKIKEILQSESFERRGYFNVEKIRSDFDKFLKGEKDVDTTIFWRCINLELWFKVFFDNF